MRMQLLWTFSKANINGGFLAILMFLSLTLSACSTNPATGDYQFTALMPESQENSLGAQEHQKVIQQYGLYDDDALQAYVSGIGARVTKQTERPDVRYKFYVIDSPIVNAFALPGGYIYVSRGLLALANSEAELAGVLGHEAGHITARHSAERYSHGVLTSLGANVLSVVIGNSAASQAIGTGANLYLSGYSRGQENQADTLGIRYMSQGGYDVEAMSKFLHSMHQQTTLSLGEEKDPSSSYFSTHPPTAERVSKTKAEASEYHQNSAAVGRDVYLAQIQGLVYGDSAKQGFERNGTFYHPEMGFQFDVPDGFELINSSKNVVARDEKSGAISLFDFAKNTSKAVHDAREYLQSVWMKGEKIEALEHIQIGAMDAATAQFQGKINGKSMFIRLIAIDWGDGRFARFQIGVPDDISSEILNALNSHSYSFRRMNAQDKKRIQPAHVDVIVARAGDTLESFAQKQMFKGKSEQHFRVLNGMDAGQVLLAGQKYKLIRY